MLILPLVRFRGGAALGVDTPVHRSCSAKRCSMSRPTEKWSSSPMPIALKFLIAVSLENRVGQHRLLQTVAWSFAVRGGCLPLTCETGHRFRDLRQPPSPVLRIEQAHQFGRRPPQAGNMVFF